MSELKQRFSRAFGLTVGIALGVLVLATSTTLLGGAGTATTTTTQYRCRFMVTKPSLTSGKANFAVTAFCASSRDKRTLDVQLVADDPSYDDTLRETLTSIPMGKGMYTVKGRGWRCHEDAKGKDEVYLRMRVKARHGTSQQKAKWVNGPATSGNCH